MTTEFKLDAGEHVKRSVRKHWVVLVLEMLPFALIAIVPLIIPPFLLFIGRGESEALEGLIAMLSFENSWVRLFMGLWWLLLWIAAFNTFTSYYLNEWIITSRRIVEITQRGFFSREVSSTLLNRVQDVTTDVNGILPTLFGYGTLTVQSAGANDYFHMHGIPHPQELRDLVMHEIAALHKGQNTSFLPSL